MRHDALARFVLIDKNMVRCSMHRALEDIPSLLRSWYREDPWNDRIMEPDRNRASDERVLIV